MPHAIDKNIGNEAVATARFKEIKEAYETLKDPNERAWYNKNRDTILRPQVVLVRCTAYA